jgi:hypothetical protein
MKHRNVSTITKPSDARWIVSIVAIFAVLIAVGLVGFSKIAAKTAPMARRDVPVLLGAPWAWCGLGPLSMMFRDQ